jgi:hypothetical protein
LRRREPVVVCSKTCLVIRQELGDGMAAQKQRMMTTGKVERTCVARPVPSCVSVGGRGTRAVQDTTGEAKHALLDGTCELYMQAEAICISHCIHHLFPLQMIAHKFMTILI